MYAKAIWRMFMEDLNELKEKNEDKYYSEIFSISKKMCRKRIGSMLMN